MSAGQSDRLGSLQPGRIRDVLLRSTESRDAQQLLRMYLSVDAEAVLDHLEHCFGDHFSYGVVPERRKQRFNILTEWGQSSLTREVERLVTVLNESLSLPRVGALDLVSVLDWSETAAEKTLGSVHTHRGRGPGVQMERARQLAARPRVGTLALHSLVEDMARVVRAHPAYNAADIIIGGPDGLGDMPNLRTQLAQGLAAATGKELILLRWPVWQIADSAPNLSTLGRRLSGPSIVVDDVWTDGTTMSAIGRLARASGASHVYGLAATIAHKSETMP